QQLTSRTKYVCCCMEADIAPRASIIVRRLHTTKAR
ncbi:unnamed protein product, partial [Choristocarpus tenellus]